MDPSGLLDSMRAEMEILPKVGELVDLAAAQMELQAQGKILNELEDVTSPPPLCIQPSTIFFFQCS